MVKKPQQTKTRRGGSAWVQFEVQILKQTGTEAKPHARSWRWQLHGAQPPEDAGRMESGSRPKNEPLAPRVSGRDSDAAPDEAIPASESRERSARRAAPHNASLCRAAAEARPRRPDVLRCTAGEEPAGRTGKDGQPLPRVGEGAAAACFLPGQKERKRSANLNLLSEKELTLGTKALCLPSWAVPAKLVVTALLPTEFR